METSALKLETFFVAEIIRTKRLGKGGTTIFDKGKHP